MKTNDHRGNPMRPLILSIALVFIASLAFAFGPPREGEHPTLAIGAAAPDFSLPGVDGKTYSLKDFKQANVLVLVFTCVHCPTAQGYEEDHKAYLRL